MAGRTRWKRTAGRIAGIALVGLVLWFSPQRAASQPPRQVIYYMQPVEGELGPGAQQVVYTMSLHQNAVFSLVAWPTSGDLALELSISDPLGQMLANSPMLDSGTAVEAARAPESGTYRVTLRAAGSTSGSYRVLLLPGYAHLDRWERFSEGASPLEMTWGAVENTTAYSRVSEGVMQMDVFEGDTISYIGPEAYRPWSDMYIEADVAIVGSPSYFEYGFLLRVDRTGGRFVSVTLSSDGDWTVYIFDNGDWRAIQPWTISPAIDPADRTPHLGVLVSGNQLQVFFNRQSVGEVALPAAVEGEGGMALAVATGSGQPDPLAVQFDNLVITSPGVLPEALSPNLDYVGWLPEPSLALAPTATPASGQPYRPTANTLVAPSATAARRTPTAAPPANGTTLTTWDSGSPSSIVSDLNSQGIIPAGGEISLQVPRSFGSTSASGFSYYELGRGRTFGDFVLAFDARLDPSGPESGCGMRFRASDESSSFALVMANGTAFLGQVNDGMLSRSSFFDESAAINVGPGTTNHVLVVAVGAAMRMYVNGHLVTAGEFEVREGTVGVSVFVAEDESGNTELTYCQVENVWLWAF
ncbi:MAG: hypothetical protein GYB65_10490 [Chloroflexi bacterium]|nr:hypothetical protein [Chloroflexota bacterium]